MERLKDNLQEDFLLKLDICINTYKEFSFIDKSSGVLYIPIDYVNENLTEKCENLQELLNNKFILIEEDEVTNQQIITLTYDGLEYLNWRFQQIC